MNGPGSRNIHGRFHRSHHRHCYGSTAQPRTQSFHTVCSRIATRSPRKVNSFNKNMHYNAFPTLLTVVMFLSLPSSMMTLTYPVISSIGPNPPCRIPSSSIFSGRPMRSSHSNRILPCSNWIRATFPSKTAAAATATKTIATETTSTSLFSSGSFNEIDNFIMELSTYQNYKLALALQTGIGTLVLTSIAILVYRNGWRDSSGKRNIWERRVNQRRKFNGKRYDNYYFDKLVLMLRKSYAGGLLWLLTIYYRGYVSLGLPYPKQGPIASDSTNPTDVKSIDNGSPLELSQQLQQSESDTDAKMNEFDEEIDDAEDDEKEEIVPIEKETASDIETIEEYVTTSADSTVEETLVSPVVTLTSDPTTSSDTPPLLEAAAAAMVLPAPSIDGANKDPLLPILVERMEKEKNRPILPPLSSVSLPSIKTETNQTARILGEVKELASTLEKVQETIANEKVEKARIFAEVLDLANSFEKIRETIDLNSDLYKERLSAYEDTIKSLEEAVVNKPYYLTELNDSTIDNLESNETEEDWLMEENIIDRQEPIEAMDNEDIDIAESTITMENKDIYVPESATAPTASTIVDDNNAVNEPPESSTVKDDETPLTTPTTTTANEDMDDVESTSTATTPTTLNELCEPSIVGDDETSSTTPLTTTTANGNLNIADYSETSAVTTSIVANNNVQNEPSEAFIVEDDEVTLTAPLKTTTASEDIDVADSIAAATTEIAITTTTTTSATIVDNNTVSESSTPSIVEDIELPSIPTSTTTAANEEIDAMESTTIFSTNNAVSELSEPSVVEDNESPSTTVANEDIDVAGLSSTEAAQTANVGDNSAVGEDSESSIVEDDEPPSTTPPKKSLKIVPEYEVARRLFDVAFQDEKQRQEAYIQKGRDPVAELRRDRQLDAEILHNARKKEVDYIVRHGGLVKGKLPPLRKRVGQGADSGFVEGTEDRQVDGSTTKTETQEYRRVSASGSLPALRKRAVQSETADGIDSRRIGDAIKKDETNEGESWLVNAERGRQLHRERYGIDGSNNRKKGGFYRSAQLGTWKNHRRFGKQTVVDTSTTVKRGTVRKTGRGVLLSIKRQKQEEEVTRSKRYGLGHIISPASSSSVEVVSAATENDSSSRSDSLQPTTAMRMRNGTRTGTGTGTGWSSINDADRKQQLNAFAISNGTSSMESMSNVFGGVENREGAGKKLWNTLGRRKVWIIALTIAIGREALPMLLTKRIFLTL